MTFALLLSGKSQAETAIILGVSRRTINRWAASDEFKRACDETYNNTIKILKALLLAGYTIAVKEKLKQVMQGDKKAIDFFAKGLKNNFTLNKKIFNPQEETDRHSQLPVIRTSEEFEEIVDQLLKQLPNKELETIANKNLSP